MRDTDSTAAATHPEPTGILAIQQSMVPRTDNLGYPAPGIELNLVTKTASRRPVRAALSNSFGFGGHNVVLAFCTA
ncbi:hypothetical protein [Streptomyces sp. RKAG293]|uniref:hypothetical protein n=1 Tax=Streptomyces sp. RKAG293 TaxID=2893403 RepID=UPI002033B7A3|nr:hypothetical protein [Streptomyces sp. RKAG293]MCM2422693.1 hypothetical protein [Streptomyces sp. RKAG293]